MIFLLTIDVERISFADNAYHNSIAERVANEALPKLMDLLNQYNIKGTFYPTAKYAESEGGSLRAILKRGHEVGCHGLDHSKFDDTLGFDQQLKTLNRSKEIIEERVGKEIISFRAPALRINKYTVKALEEAGFRTDSSVASQRFDGPLTSGAFRKLNWLTASRNPYYLSYQTPYRAGDSTILEIPLTALIWSFTGTHMRLSPFVTSVFQKLFMQESRITKKPLVFLFHPNELLSFSKTKTKARGNYFNDTLRHRLKMKNLGDTALSLLEQVLIRAKKAGGKFITVKDYYEREKVENCLRF